MTSNTVKQLGIIMQALAAIGTELLGAEEGATPTPSNAENPPAEPAAPKRRGRPAGSTNAPAAEEKPAAGEKAPEPAKEPTTEGMPIEALRELIAPIIKEGRGAEVKALIEQHGGSKLSDIPAANRAAFAKAVEDLQY